MLVEICVLEIFVHKSYATLLNCWKFLKFYRTKFRWFISTLNGFHESERLLKSIEMLQWITSSQVLTKLKKSLGRRSQTKMAVGNFSI
jgi:hypothetical protein